MPAQPTTTPKKKKKTPETKNKTKKQQRHHHTTAAFAPKRTAFAPCHVCWDVILSNRQTAVTLDSWRWLRVLSQVFRCMPSLCDDMALAMCAQDRRPVIWKKKVNELFALTPSDLGEVCFQAVEGTKKWSKLNEVHLMFRRDALRLGLKKHGGTIAAVNAAFVKRRTHNAQRKKRRALDWQKQTSDHCSMRFDL
jgi:hypothetical protein